VQALVSGHAPTATVIADAERAIPYLPDRPEARAPFYFTVANYLAEHGGPLDTALLYANRALSEAPDGENYRGLKSLSRLVLGRVQMERGQYAEAIGQLEMAVSDAPDSQSVLFQLGRAYEKAGHDADAERAWLRSLGVFAADDTSAAAPLRALYAKRHGSLAGLDAAIAAVRRASRQNVALTTQRMEKPAPDWTLPDLEGQPVALASHKGKVVVLDFWGSWCGPCRQELPKFEALYRRYRDNPKVAFIGVNWERVASADLHLTFAKRYMEENKLTFPAVYDHDRVAVEGYQLEAFPTVFLIDRAGVIRYRDVGFTPGIDAIIEAQLESLLE
jgi:thiol-disulfide isomerase/thioredoxin